MTRMPPHALNGLCSFALRMSNGQFIAVPEHSQPGTYSIDYAQLWLWPLLDSDKERAVRIEEIRKLKPWAGPLVAVRARS
jgi:hypothetical protein